MIKRENSSHKHSKVDLYLFLVMLKFLYVQLLELTGCHEGYLRICKEYNSNISKLMIKTFNKGVQSPLSDIILHSLGFLLAREGSLIDELIEL